LRLFFGCFSAHRFYVVKSHTAIAQLVLTFSVIGILVSSPWVLIDWILIFTSNFRDDMDLKVTEWNAN